MDADTPTPWTDRFVTWQDGTLGSQGHYIVPAKIARKLERERNEARASYLELVELVGERELALRKGLENIRDATENCNRLKVLPPSVKELQQLAATALEYGR